MFVFWRTFTPLLAILKFITNNSGCSHVLYQCSEALTWCLVGLCYLPEAIQNNYAGFCFVVVVLHCILLPMD